MSPRSRADRAGSVPERRDVYERLADELRQAGFSDVTWRNLTGGIVAVHRAVRD